MNISTAENNTNKERILQSAGVLSSELPCSLYYGKTGNVCLPLPECSVLAFAKPTRFHYTALDEHTAVAEVRPLIGDKISIATLKTVRPLQLVNFDYEPDGTSCGIEIFF